MSKIIPGMYVNLGPPPALPSYRNFLGQVMTDETVRAAQAAVESLRHVAEKMRQFIWVELNGVWAELAYETSNEALSNAQGIIRLINGNLWRHHHHPYSSPRGLIY